MGEDILLGPLVLFACAMCLTPGPNVVMVTASAANFGFHRAIPQILGITLGFGLLVMAAGLAANLTANPFASVTTVTVQIVQLLTGDQEFDSAKTLAAFALGLALFLITLLLNLIALHIVRRFQEQYE